MRVAVCCIAAVIFTPLSSAAGRRGAALPLHTSGRYVVDSNGQRVKLAAVNWYGAEEQDYVVAGLEYASLASIAHRIRTMGFNTVRLPWSNEMFESNPVIADARLAANPDLKGLHALDVLDSVIRTLAAEGVYVVLDNHTSTADWCCSNTDGNGFWYNAAYPESSWIADWQAMAKRYANQPAVIGADLRNEPRGPVWAGSDPRYDWHAAAERAGNAILAANPNLLIIVEGVNYAADLTGVRDTPVRLNIDNHLVYSSHDYAWFHNGMSSYGSLKSQLDSRWGFLLDPTVNTPVWVGEFGTCHTSATCIASTTISDSGFWFSAFTRYLQERDLDWAYWAVNGTQARGTSRTLGGEETYGILKKNWQAAASTGLLNALQAIVPASAAPAIDRGGVVNPATFSPDVPLVPGSLASVFGNNLSGVTASADAGPLPSALGGAQIQTSSGVLAPVLFASPAQVNIQIPWETDPAAAFTLTAALGSLSSPPEPVRLAPASPVIFAIGAGTTQGAVIIANTDIVAARATSDVPNARPAHAGEYVSIFCTGLGKVTHQPATGYPAVTEPLASTIATPVVKIAGVPSTPIFSGLAPGFVGLYQINVQISPDTPQADAVPVSVVLSGIESNVVTIAIER